jgi:hypothetical protein
VLVAQRLPLDAVFRAPDLNCHCSALVTIRS